VTTAAATDEAALAPLAAAVGERLAERGLRLVLAESCTGGLVAKAVTDVAGSSAWFERGFVTYSNEAKRESLGVSEQTLAVYGAVSEMTVREMVMGALMRSRGELAVAVSGIAGPGGGTPDKPVGTVWLAWKLAGGEPRAEHCVFEGDRAAVRTQAAMRALQGVLDMLDG